MQKKSRQQTEFGDFQTPAALAADVCRLLAQAGVAPRAVVEPTCGRGSLLLAALDRFPSIQRAVTLERDARHLEALRADLRKRPDAGRVTLVHGDFFHTDWSSLLAPLPDPLLVLGNPPWVTNAALGRWGGRNLPRKTNFQQRSGLDAVTGKSNFDICESIMLEVARWLDGRQATMAMLCKSAVARKVLAHVWQHDTATGTAALYEIDAGRHFAASVRACLLVARGAPSGNDRAAPAAKEAAVYGELGAAERSATLAWRRGELIADAARFDQWQSLLSQSNDGEPVYRWRSGVKHDCARVMELCDQSGELRNKLGEVVEIEPDYVYPLLKGSELAHGKVGRPVRRLIVPQTTLGETTDAIRDAAPRTWRYLDAHGDDLDGRKSSVYRKRPRFAVFGVGPYTFAPFKVAICGLYKRLHFQVVGQHEGRPVVFDDTVNFLPCRSRAEAELLAGLLHSEPAQQFYAAFLFWDAKRPITVDVLRRLDLFALARRQGCESRLRTLLNDAGLHRAAEGRPGGSGWN